MWYLAGSPLTGKQSRGIKLTLVGVVILVAVVAGSYLNRVGMPRVMTAAELKLNGAYIFATPRALPEFTLTDHRGRAFDKGSLQNRWTLVFFGFTHCPDICPTTMAELGRFLGLLDGLPERRDTRVVMVTVDPARDGVEELAQYVPYFNPDLLGVTGEFPDIHRFATALNAPFRTAPGPGANYQMEHSSNLVLINPRGDYHGFFRAPLDPAKLKVTYRSIRAVWN